jgi:hypothetical protein
LKVFFIDSPEWAREKGRTALHGRDNEDNGQGEPRRANESSVKESQGKLSEIMVSRSEA